MAEKTDAERIARVQPEIIKLLKAGNYRNHVAKEVGISYTMFRDWMRWGEDGKRKEPYKSFAFAVLTAESHAVTECVGYVMSAAKKDWKAATWFLARKAPHEWGDQSRKSVKQQLESILRVIEETLGKESAATVFDEIARRASVETSSGSTPGEVDKPTQH